MSDVDKRLKDLDTRVGWFKNLNDNWQKWLFAFYYEILECDLVSPNLYILLLIFQNIQIMYWVLLEKFTFVWNGNPIFDALQSVLKYYLQVRLSSSQLISICGINPL